jgi:hypothetical protein
MLKMSQKVYKLFLIDKWSEAWYQLSEEEQEGLLVKVDEALEKVGGKRVLLCQSGWSSEEWRFFGIEEFPDVAAVQRHTALLDEFDLSRYSNSMSLLGTEWQPPE